MSDSLHQKYLKTLPPEWEQVRIEMLGKVYAGSTPSRTEPSFWNGPIAWVTPTELTSLDSKWLTETKESITHTGLSASAAKLLPKGSLLVTTRATIGYVAIAGIPVATNQGFKSIIPNELANSDYYYHLLRRITPEMKRLASGSTFDEISRRDFIAILVPRPDISEQIQIAKILDTVDASIQCADALIDKLRHIKKGLLQDLLRYGLNEHSQLRDPEAHPEQFKDSMIGPIPREWEVRSLQACVRPDAPITYGIVQAGPHIEDGVPYIRTGDMSGSHLTIDGLLRTSKRIASSYSRSEVKAGEIVCAIRATVGKVLEVPPELDGANLTQGTARIAPHSDINNRFLLWALRSDAVKRQFDLAVKGTTFQEITLGDLRNIQLAIPLHRIEQDRIAEILDAHDDRIYAQEAYRDKLKLLKKGLMEDLLSGRVRVKNNVERIFT